MSANKATDKMLGELHGKLASVMLSALSNSERAAALLEEFRDELPEEVVKFLDNLDGASPATLTAIAKFLKDNSITCAIEDNDEMSELQERLNDKKRLRKRVGNVIPIEE